MRSRGEFRAGWYTVVGAVGVHDGGDDRIEIGGGIAQHVGGKLVQNALEELEVRLA